MRKYHVQQKKMEASEWEDAGRGLERARQGDRC